MNPTSGSFNATGISYKMPKARYNILDRSNNGINYKTGEDTRNVTLYQNFNKRLNKHLKTQ